MLPVATVSNAYGIPARPSFFASRTIHTAIIVSAIIIFVYTFGSYEVAWLLGRPYPEPLPVLAFRLFDAISLTSRPEAAAVAVITTAVSLVVVALGMALLRRTPLWR